MTKLLSFEAAGTHRVGVMLDDSRIADLSARLTSRPQTLVSLLKQGLNAEIDKVVSAGVADYTVDEIEFDPVIPKPQVIWCVGLNYVSHREETNHWGAKEPTIFMRSWASQVGHRKAIYKPAVSEQFDYEGELAVVIGKPGRHISRDEALNHVAGYSCYNEGSVRDWQKHSPQYGPGKNFWASGAFGPWLVSPDEFGNPEDNRLTTRINDQVVQNSLTDLLVFDIPKLISYLSDVAPLQTGDVIVTGTPAGVGSRQTPPRFLQPGDEVSIEITNIGTLVNKVSQEPSVPEQLAMLE